MTTNNKAMCPTIPLIPETNSFQILAKKVLNRTNKELNKAQYFSLTLTPDVSHTDQ